MTKQIVHAPKAGAPVGPYSQAVVAGGLIFVCGEKGVDPQTSEIVKGGVAAQTRQAILNIQAILEAASASLNQVVRCVVYMTDLGKFNEMNEVYGEFFDNDPPARTTVGVSDLPLGLQVMIEVTALSSKAKK